ncbi:MAG: serine/threonine-protein kinase [Anaerolineae bacterium]|nr:serine/threonine-protein kinase [Anaerolineae bacterium]
MSDNAPPYNVNTIHKLLLASFTPQDLRRFCRDRPLFSPVLARFGTRHGLVDMADEVIDYCQTQALFDQLLSEIEQENPAQYARFEPSLRSDVEALAIKILNPGNTLLKGKYRIDRHVARGGFGSIYLAEDTLLYEDVAIKELIPALVGDEQALRRFLTEARTTMKLAHPHVAHTRDVFAEAGNYYMVMEWAPGGSLEDLLRDRPSLPVDEAVRIAEQVAEGLAYAHSHGVVHCDLKPGNILFGADGSAKVADFGVAHVSEQTLTRSWSTGGAFVAGTLPYMSPEQTDGVRDDPRVDVYALGAVLYRMLTGGTYLEFDQRDTPRAQSENVQRICAERPAAPSLRDKRIPPWLDRLVLKALAKQPEARFASMDELRAALLRPPRARARPAPRPGPTPPSPAVPAPEAEPEPPPEPAEERPLPAPPSPAVPAPEAEPEPSPEPAEERPLPATPLPGTAPGPGAAAHRPRAARAPLPAWLWPVAAVLFLLVVGGILLIALPGPGSPEQGTPAATGLATLPLSTSLVPSGSGRGNGRIAFTSDRAGSADIYLVDPDGSDPVRLTDSEADERMPAWSPAGDRIAFVADQGGDDEIYLVNADGSGLTQLTDNSAGDWWPTWSPDGRRIAFASDRDGNPEIYLMNADGSDQTRLTHDDAVDWMPAWAPDGRIAFTTNRDGDGDIYLMNADGSGLTRLTDDPANDYGPHWSRGGDRIAFTSERDGNAEIYLMNADGNGQTRLTDDLAEDSAPAWSRGGDRIAFESWRDGNREIYLMDADGSNLARLTDDPAQAYDPDWSP